MLKTLDWIIPNDTKESMTPADWILLVLSVYFHDIGLLITKNEFENRFNNTDYKNYLANPVISAEKYKDYNARLSQMSSDLADRLRYQDFVRYTHGKRVRAWLDGSALDDGKSTEQMRSVIHDLLGNLDLTIKKDLALLCESHTQGNIDDINTYKLSQPYGGPEETANLQYCAVILRTVDLLQITRRRAPSVLYQLVNPGDPNSQTEWQKQNAVRTVRPALGRDRDGHVSETALSDTVEVHATFKEPDGFFGLTSYLRYAQIELTRSYIAIQKSSKDVIRNYLFPWREIDLKYIDTEGFLTDSFEFELDQHKILDLLTGHTLYNDTKVVLRELTQNALDAVRLQADIDKNSSAEYGQVDIVWDSAKRSLTVTDNGTGMSQEVIESHLLKVGSSRYQDPKFKEKHPGFHSISRFGIGVLSAFMVSDDVEITTCSEDEEDARRIALRSVHGKYLIKLLNKISDRPQLPMLPHGTSVRLILRPTADVGDVLMVARSWLMFPRCRVRVTIDSDEPVQIGYVEPKEALSAYIEATSVARTGYKREYKVKQFEQSGVKLAFAVAKDELFQDWGFVEISRDRRPDDDIFIPIATCVEGVAVEQTTPGFRARSILAIADAIGPQAPRTNVARSALEDTNEQRQMLETIYSLYSHHITDEIARLSSTESHSLSRAVGVAPFIAAPLTGQLGAASKPALLIEAMSEVPLVLLEDMDKRQNVSFKSIAELKEFWTVESSLYRSIEYFVREAPADITAQNILSILGNKATGKLGPIVCNLNTSQYVEDNIKRNFEVTEIRASEEARQIELRWIKRERNGDLWLSSTKLFEQLGTRDVKFWRALATVRERVRGGRSTAIGGINVPGPHVKATGLDAYGSFVANRERYLVPNEPLSLWLYNKQDRADVEKQRSLAVYFLVLEYLINLSVSWDLVTPELVGRATEGDLFEDLRLYLNDNDGFANAALMTKVRSFNPFAWDRRDQKSADDFPF